MSSITLEVPDEVLTLRASPALQERISTLLEKNRTGDISSEEELEWQRIEYLEHPTALSRGVYERAMGRCEYCRIPVHPGKQPERRKFHRETGRRGAERRTRIFSSPRLPASL